MTKQENKTSEALKFCKAIIEGEYPKNKEYSDLLDLSEKFRKKHKEVEENRPYHMNVLDEVREKDSETGRKILDENFHSRVLCKLLQYNKDGKYVFLESLLKFISGKCKSFGEIKINQPIITQEKKRIDLWVRENRKYAIIFENKIYNAKDQEAQIARYIQKTIEEGFKKNQIFVVYLSYRGEEPDSDSWRKYKREFNKHYINISYYYDIIEWLQNEKNNEYDCLLNSALIQYEDYLTGLFNIRDIDNEIKINEFLIEHEKLNFKDMEASLDKLTERFNAIEKKKNELEDLKQGFEGC
ncbi:MAG: PD-(D/E)XK nuclease family protein, partial [Bacteroidales bacterium]|nr:PD-(D/E)XK nuclease family protein [Bacteroidales bacterium]